MGARDFQTYAAGADVAIAFRAAVEDARHEHGHGGYSGTIAEKDGYTVIVSDSRPVSLSQARAIAGRLITNEDPRVDDKWGPAGAIAVADKDAFKTKTRAVTLRGKDLERHINAEYAAEKAGLPTAGLTGIKVLSDERKTKVVAKAGAGKRVTRYEIRAHGRRVDERDSQATARRRAVELAGREHTFGEDEYEIVAVTTKEAGPLVTVKKETTGRVVKAELSYSVPTGAAAAPAGWLFFGMASS